ncbi:hypothetical protein CXG81DRAFT_19048 [Caulochytrium protostelioides]|uniref:Uncharacterized protein n=1 Tax=Caulochytrium protostelioides TaxID=1555241 RepID=A0A4P9X7E5_9FUNG|nr:hypothetical protein CXG81DRAFT_19048 [Caulochytrium protostelioides]|eukprot:RKP01138.1 hypothetical protein CXG81DRAFT_19048 [Caulochytrium protostelioides]
MEEENALLQPVLEDVDNTPYVPLHIDLVGVGGGGHTPIRPRRNSLQRGSSAPSVTQQTPFSLRATPRAGPPVHPVRSLAGEGNSDESIVDDDDSDDDDTSVVELLRAECRDMDDPDENENVQAEADDVVYDLDDLDASPEIDAATMELLDILEARANMEAFDVDDDDNDDDADGTEDAISRNEAALLDGALLDGLDFGYDPASANANANDILNSPVVILPEPTRPRLLMPDRPTARSAQSNPQRITEVPDASLLDDLSGLSALTPGEEAEASQVVPGTTADAAAAPPAMVAPPAPPNVTVVRQGRPGPMPVIPPAPPSRRVSAPATMPDYKAMSAESLKPLALAHGIKPKTKGIMVQQLTLVWRFQHDGDAFRGLYMRELLERRGDGRRPPDSSQASPEAGIVLSQRETAHRLSEQYGRRHVSRARAGTQTAEEEDATPSAVALAGGPMSNIHGNQIQGPSIPGTALTSPTRGAARSDTQSVALGAGHPLLLADEAQEALFCRLDAFITSRPALYAAFLRFQPFDSDALFREIRTVPADSGDGAAAPTTTTTGAAGSRSDPTAHLPLGVAVGTKRVLLDYLTSRGFNYILSSTGRNNRSSPSRSRGTQGHASNGGREARGRRREASQFSS